MKRAFITIIFLLESLFAHKIDNATILLSYPCSGNHLTRFIIEYISGLPTTGTNFGRPCKDGIPIAQKQFEDAQLLAHVDCTKSFIAYKSHTIETIQEHCNSIGKLILVVRSFKECIPSKARKMETYLQKKDCRGYLDLVDFFLYLDLIEYYDLFNGPKLLIYYEDLLNNPVKIAQKLYSFLGLTDNKYLLDFEKNEKTIIKKSREIKNKEGFGAYPYLNKSGSCLNFHQKKLDKDLVKKREGYIKTMWKGSSFLHYIEHYFV